jgi:hypothetical protein
MLSFNISKLLIKYIYYSKHKTPRTAGLSMNLKEQQVKLRQEPEKPPNDTFNMRLSIFSKNMVIIT